MLSMSTAKLLVSQPFLPDLCPITSAVDVLANAGGVDERGAIFTRREVVDFILDLCGYTTDQPLHRHSLLEPSFGGGDFLLPAIARLLAAWSQAGATGDPVRDLGPCIRGVELHRATFQRTRAAVVARLVDAGISDDQAVELADVWLIQGDFLLADLPLRFDWVVGNPPYVRQELIPPVLMAEYRQRYATVYDRADLYVPFIERGLRQLAAGGVLGFICADRWMKNRYGAKLRALVASDYHLQAYVDMTDTPAFHSDVIAYPAITVIASERGGITRVAHRPAIDGQALAELARHLTAPMLTDASHEVREMVGVTDGDQPWILDSADQMNLLRRLERELPLLEDTGCKVGIGVATGADRAFIGRYDELDVEEDRKLPLVMTRDITSGRIVWRGQGVVNPFADGPGSGLVALDDYPRLKRYLEARHEVIARRHCARKAPASWYRTIDRITASLTQRPKLLIPDIKGQAQIVHDEGRFYPHHNLYYVIAEEWDLRALQAVLLSDVALLFVVSYSTKMRGGFLRFQAQYLRRIRLPYWKDVPDELRSELKTAAEVLDLVACNRAVFELYGLSAAERAALGQNDD